MTLEELLALLPDNTTGAIDADDLRTIVTELWNQGAAIQARVAALETRDGGDGYLATVNGRWQVNPTPGNPGGKQMSADQASWAMASVLRFDPVDLNNNDLSTALLEADDLFGQQQSDATNWMRWRVSGAASDEGSYIEVPVTMVASGGSISGAQWQEAQVVIGKVVTL